MGDARDPCIVYFLLIDNFGHLKFCDPKTINRSDTTSLPVDIILTLL